MNFKLATVLAGLTLAFSAAPAAAGDYDYGGGSLKDYGGGPVGVPVPAPVPMPLLRADYYLRADVGVGLSDSMSASETGLVYGQDAASNDVTVPSSWASGDGTLPMTFGFGVGRYWSDSFRTDLTIEWMRQAKAYVKGQMTYTNEDGATVNVAMHDETTREGGLFLFNGYYDFVREEGARFKPYIGAGVGFALNILSRDSAVSEEICLACGGTTFLNEYSTWKKTTVTSLAAAAMVGFTYDLRDSMKLDVGYRYLYVGGSDVSVGIMDSLSTVKIEAQNEHQIRAGIRMDID